MAELNPKIRNSMVQTYGKNPFHFCDKMNMIKLYLLN